MLIQNSFWFFKNANRFDIFLSTQGSGSKTPPCSLVPIQVHSAFQRQDTFFNYLVMCHELWDLADQNVYKGNHTGKELFRMTLKCSQTQIK